jgi:putative membrane protein
MKSKVTKPVLLTRSLLTLGAGCALACLPLCVASAQEATPSPAATAETPAMTPAAETSTAAEAATSSAKLTHAEMEFVKKAGAGNAAEVKGGELAQTNADSQDVKDFGDRMIKDHGDANTDLGTIAKAHDITFPPAEMEKQKMQYDKLAKLHGAAFDKAYIKDMIADHEKDLAEYKKEKTEVKDPELKAYVDKTEAIVAEHLKMAKACESKLMSEKKS